MKDSQKIKKAIELLEAILMDGETPAEADKELYDAITSLEAALDFME